MPARLPEPFHLVLTFVLSYLLDIMHASPVARHQPPTTHDWGIQSDVLWGGMRKRYATYREITQTITKAVDDVASQLRENSFLRFQKISLYIMHSGCTVTVCLLQRCSFLSAPQQALLFLTAFFLLALTEQVNVSCPGCAKVSKIIIWANTILCICICWNRLKVKF